jgi:molecular chaperone GrpE
MEKDENINASNQDNEVNGPTSEEQNQDNEVNGPTSEEQNQDNEVNGPTPDNDEKNKVIKEITPEETIEKLEDKLARTFAEMENQRRRFEKEREDAFSYGGFAFAKETLNLIDNLERSKQILENDEILKNTEALKKTLEHFNIINRDMVSILSKNGITPVDSIGKKLDPNIHQAMMEIDDDQKEPGTIVQEIQKGFMMKDRLLRPSLVGVSKKTEKKEEKSEENIENLDN